MLVLTRKNRESVVIGRPGDLEVTLIVTVLEVSGGRVRLGFESDARTPIHRREVWERICLAAGRDGNGSGTVGVATPTSAREPVLEAVGH